MFKISKAIENIVKINIFRLIGIDEEKIKIKVKPVDYSSIFINKK
jgi:hypothetical protein